MLNDPGHTSSDDADRRGARGDGVPGSQAVDVSIVETLAECSGGLYELE